MGACQIRYATLVRLVRARNKLTWSGCHFIRDHNFLSALGGNVAVNNTICVWAI
jgi:hypothetical protein